ncbi:MAG: T9SS type A sorting domain-containing protein, partial [Saccharofermentanales bacterium]
QTSSFDSQNRITHMYMYGGDFENIGNWIPQSRLHLIYGAGTTFEIYSWDEYEEGLRVVEYSRSTFTYDAHGRISEELSYAAPDSTNWVLEDRTQHQYHPQDTSTGADFIEYLAIGLSQILINPLFEFPGHLTLSNSAYWDGSAWIPDSRTITEYDSQLKPISRLEEYYLDSMWEPDNKMVYYYEVNGQPDYTINQFYNGFEFEDEERTDYTWEDYTSATDDPLTPVVELKIRAYPSPFTEELTIQTRSASKAPLKFSIHNLRGQTVQSFSATEGQDLRWDGNFANGKKAPAGIYFIRAQQNGSTATIKTMRLQ